MIITTTESIPNADINEILDIVKGSTVRAKNSIKDLVASVRNMVGGEINEYTQLQLQSREEALQRMISDAKRLNADAIINVRFSTAMIMEGTAETLAYGTAVKLK